jgi:Protein of unknown function (DUF3485)
MIRAVLLTISALLLVASGVFHRIWTGAWSFSNEPAASAARLAEVPSTFGDWAGVDLEVDARMLERAEAVGFLSRRYVHRNGAEVSVFMICGRPGPVSVHTPDICYGGLGFHVVESQHPYHVNPAGETPAADFIWANFEKPEAVMPQRLRIYWTWKAGRGWQAPSDPRLTFGGAPALYKLYITCRPAPGSEQSEQDPCRDFMRDFLPQVEKVLSPAS